jgi:hypothetical protein
MDIFERINRILKSVLGFFSCFNFEECILISMVYVYLHVSLSDPQARPSLSMFADGCLWLPTVAYGCLWLPMVAYGCLRLPTVAYRRRLEHSRAFNPRNPRKILIRSSWPLTPWPPTRNPLTWMTVFRYLA